MKGGKPQDPNSNYGKLRALEVGESILFNKGQAQRPNYSKIYGKKFRAEKVSENQTRIWRSA